jgi:hypothetical protein
MVTEKTDEELDAQGTEAADAAYQSAEVPAAEVPAAEAPAAEPTEAPIEAPTEQPPADPPAQPTWDAGRIAALERQNSELQEGQAQQHLADEARQYHAKLIQDGQNEQDAAQIAQTHYTGRMQAWGNFKATTDLKTAYEARLNDVVTIARETGASPESLLSYGTRDEMVRAATLEKRVSDVEAENKRLRLEGVPAQKMDSAIASPTAISSFASDAERYNAGARDEAATAAGRQAANG